MKKVKDDGYYVNKALKWVETGLDHGMNYFEDLLLGNWVAGVNKKT